MMVYGIARMLGIEGLQKSRSVALKVGWLAVLIACLGRTDVGARNSPPARPELRIRIIDTNGNPVQGAVVEVLGADGKLLQREESNTQGLVSLQVTSTSGTRLRIQHPEFEERSEEIRLFI